jgi:DNA topoisomerase I
MAKNLVIVESPTKCGTVRKILGSQYEVKASFGHIAQLTKSGESDTGIRIEGDKVLCDYEPNGDRGRATLAELKKAVKDAQMVYLATDEDREGEGISSNLLLLLGLKKGQYRRVTYGEITPAAIQKAFAQARDTLDWDLVGAQRARQCLDKFVGFKVSPLLWQLPNVGKSAGRVQSCALRLVCELEEKIQAFKPEDYWSLTAEYEEGFTAHYFGQINDATIENSHNSNSLPEETSDDAVDTREVKKPESKRVNSQAEADRIIQIAQANIHKVVEYSGKKTSKNPPPPLITSSLQKIAGVRHGINAKRVMEVAQKLYERGLITYMRTDSVMLSADFAAQAREWLLGFKPAAVPVKPILHRNKKGAQEAHEAIRPTDVASTPKVLQGDLSAEEYQVYALIWRRAVASLCSPAILDKTRVVIQSGEILWEARGSILLEAGYTWCWDDISKDSQLPILKRGQQVQPLKIEAEKKQTKPPARFTEPTLIEKLEKLGVGRPSTYAGIMTTLRDGGYVDFRGEGNKPKILWATALGIETDRVLAKIFPKIQEPKFTAAMEEDLDSIAKGEKDWQKYFIGWNQDILIPALAQAKTAMNLRDTPAARAIAELLEVTEYPCPSCNQPLSKYSHVNQQGVKKTKLLCAGKPKVKCQKVIYYETSRGYWNPDSNENLGENLECSKIPCPECLKLMVQVPNKSGGFFLKCQSCKDSVMFLNQGSGEWFAPQKQIVKETQKKTPAQSKSVPGEKKTSAKSKSASKSTRGKKK